jgi:hypothetical protein
VLFFAVIYKVILKFISNLKELRIVETILKKKTNVSEHIFPNFKIYCSYHNQDRVILQIYILVKGVRLRIQISILTFMMNSF